MYSMTVHLYILYGLGIAVYAVHPYHLQQYDSPHVYLCEFSIAVYEIHRTIHTKIVIVNLSIWLSSV
jgi:hypothetical protein